MVSKVYKGYIKGISRIYQGYITSISTVYQRYINSISKVYRKYVGTSREDLLDIYNLYLRSVLEYCSVVWHSTLTVQQGTDIENVQKLCLKIILGIDYSSYDEALIITGLEKLSTRRESRCLKFGLKSLLHPVHSQLFPVNPKIYADIPTKEHFCVNWARTDSYRMSAVPFIQRKLNEYVRSQTK